MRFADAWQADGSTAEVYVTNEQIQAYRAAVAVGGPTSLVKMMQPEYVLSRDPWARTEHQLLAVVAAMVACHLPVLDLLIERYLSDRPFGSVLQEAVECGHPDVLQRVLTRRIESPEQMEYAARKAIVLGDTAMLEMLLAAAHRTGFLGLDISMLPEYPDRRVIAVLPMLLWRQVPKPTGRLRHRALIGLCMGIVSGNRASALLVCDCLHDRELFGISRARLHRAVQPYREDATAIVPLISLLLEVTGPIYDGALLSVCAEYGRLDVPPCSTSTMNLFVEL